MQLTASPPVVDDTANASPMAGHHRGFACHAGPGCLLAVRVGDAPPTPERLAAGDFGWVLAANDLPTLRHRIDLLLEAMPGLEATRGALERHDLDGAGAGCRALAPLADELRPVLIDAYQRAPKAADVQTSLGIVCLAAGRHAEGMFHLLRATPGQIEWFAVCRRYHLFRSSPAACRQLLVTATAAELVGRDEEAELLRKTLRMAVRLLRLAGLCVDRRGDLLWTRPDVLVHVRGVIEVGTAAPVVADLQPLAIHRVLAFATTPAHHAELTAARDRLAGTAAMWCIVPPTVSGTTPAIALDEWFATGAALPHDYNLLRIAAGALAHAVLQHGPTILRGIDFVATTVAAPPSPAPANDTATGPDETTVPGLLAARGFVEIAATEADVLPRQVLYARAEHV